MAITTRINYEWAVESVDEHGDIFDVCHWDTRAEAERWAQDVQPVRDGEHNRIVLVRDAVEYVDGDEDGLVDRQWAYLDENGDLPEEFDGGARVPKRFLKRRRA